MSLKIWEWSYRDVFIHDEDESLCIKKLKKNREKEIFWVKVKFKQDVYTLLKFWIKDLNKYDFGILKRVKEIIPENIPSHFEMTDEWLVESIIKNFDWKISENIKTFKWDLPNTFFEELKVILDNLIENNMEPMDILSNTIVQEYEEWKYKPILFDFKRIGWRTYLLQPWLLFSKNQREKKVYRKLEKIKESFNK